MIAKLLAGESKLSAWIVHALLRSTIHVLTDSVSVNLKAGDVPVCAVERVKSLFLKWTINVMPEGEDHRIGWGL